MKDYTFNDIDKRNFITKYLICDNKIIVKYAKIEKEDDIFPYTIEKELEILNKMENQVNNYEEIKKNIKGKIKNAKLLLFSLGTLIYFDIYTLINSYNSVVAWFSIFFVGLTIIIDILNLKDDTAILKDLEKSKFYLDNKEIFNKKEIIKSKSLSKNMLDEKININTLENYSLEELTIKRDSYIKKEEINNKKVKRLILNNKNHK